MSVIGAVCGGLETCVHAHSSLQNEKLCLERHWVEEEYEGNWAKRTRRSGKHRRKLPDEGSGWSWKQHLLLFNCCSSGRENIEILILGNRSSRMGLNLINKRENAASHNCCGYSGNWEGCHLIKPFKNNINVEYWKCLLVALFPTRGLSQECTLLQKSCICGRQGSSQSKLTIPLVNQK